jgi:cardiolipin synthase
MVVFLVPFAGSLLYLLIGFEARKHKTFIEKARRDGENIKEIMNSGLSGLKYREEQDEIFKKRNVVGGDYSHMDDLLYLIYNSGGALTFNNDVEYYFEGRDKFFRLFEDILNAKNFIHLEYYIFKNDRLGKRMVEALAAKAAEGVEVCLLIDVMGTSLVPRSFYREIVDAGGKLAVFAPPMFIRMNYRNHRKIAMIDGQIGYIGGLNIGDEYLGLKKRFGHWRDAHMRICGDAVNELEQRFILDWNYVSTYKIIAEDSYLPRRPRRAGVPIQVISSGPDTKWHSIYHAIIKMMTEADTSIYIQTPYFSPDDALLETLKIAALSGIDVRIIIPKHPDHLFVYWASASYLSELVPCGVKCYEYENGFLHSKLIIVDGIAASIGTANMDIRSFKLNFEVNAFIFDKDSVKPISDQFLTDLKDCCELTPEIIKNLKISGKIKEAFARLISPLL